MKTYTVILGVLLSVIAGAAQAESLTSYQEAYRNGINQFQDGKLLESSESLYQAIELAPNPEASPNEYLPYLNLSITLFKMGQTRAARDALIQSQVFGVAAQTKTGTSLLERYASEIMSAPLDDSQFVLSPPTTAVNQDQPNEEVAQTDETLALSETDITAIEEKTIKRCISSITKADDKLPWFFYYQCGVELMEREEAQMAVKAFEMGAKAVDDPRRGKRMYGMWFVDYLPYYQMALAHSQLGNWESANNAIESSETRGEFSPSDPDYEQFSALDQLIKRKLQSSDS